MLKKFQTFFAPILDNLNIISMEKSLSIYSESVKIFQVLPHSEALSILSMLYYSQYTVNSRKMTLSMAASTIERLHFTHSIFIRTYIALIIYTYTNTISNTQTLLFWTQLTCFSNLCVYRFRSLYVFDFLLQ